MCLMITREIDLQELFKHELSPVPTAMFDDDGEMRIAKSKSVLKNKLQIEQSARQVHNPGVVVIDGCAILWHIQWPTSGIIKNCVGGFIAYVFDKLLKTKVHIIFNRYYEYSIL